MRQLALLLATLFCVVLCVVLVYPFLSAMVWALTIAVLATPVHRRLRRAFRDSAIAATVSVVALAFALFIPLIYLGQHLLTVLLAGLTGLQEQVAKTDWQALASSYPSLAWITGSIDAKDLASAFGNVGNWVTGLAGAVVRGSVENVVMLLLTFYLLFFFLRDRDAFLDQTRKLSPLTDDETDRVFGRIADTIHGIVFGTMVTATIQGILGGLVFWLLGLPNPLFWGVVMGLLSVIPVLGAFVIWLPAALWLGLTGDWWKAAVLAAYGTVVIGGIDNVLHPILAGGKLQLHTVPTFIAVVGGLIFFGAAGLILGPVILTVTITLLEVWRDRASKTGAQARAEQE